MSEQKLTPMFEQYLGIKEEYPEALLFFRMGDFYELFFEDAETAARELQITLTSRNPKSDAKVPMAGVPHHAVESYLAQLLDKGYKVAICDQIEDPKQAKGLVKRAVTRILTPGTVLDENSLGSKSNNFLAALNWSATHGSGGLAWLDYSTGKWSGLQTKKEEELWQWVDKINPSELLVPEETALPKHMDKPRGFLNRLSFKVYFEYAAAKDKVESVLKVRDLRVLDLHDKRELVQACGAILAYVQQTQKHDLEHIEQFKPLNLTKHLLLDEVTERNLELFRRLDGKGGPGTLLHILDRTMTPMGGRLLQERLHHPWREKETIETSLEVVNHFYDRDQLRIALREQLKHIYDMERLSTRVFLGRAHPKDYVALRDSLHVLPYVREMLQPDAEAPFPKHLSTLLEKWDDLADYQKLLAKALVDAPPPVITEGGLFRQGFSEKLDACIELAEHGQGLLDKLLEKEQQSSGLNKLKLGFNKVFGYYLELPKSQADKAPAHYNRRQTLANCERFITPELKELEEKLISASEQRKTLEYAMFQELRDSVAQARPRLLFMAQLLAALDYWQGLADAARRYEWCRPLLHTGIELTIKGGRHPVVEAVQGAANFIANDVSLDSGRTLLLITGPNMAGKSTVLRQCALICIMAQLGSFVPAQEATIGLTDRIFSRVGASDNLAQGQSTFMVEMTETARIIRQAGKRSLVILDEIGRGTSTFDGLALAWAVVEDMAGRGGGVRTLFATHYHELTALEGIVPGVKNMNIAVKEWGGDIVFLRRLVPGPADRSYGIEVAKLAGVPRTVVHRARQLLQELEQKSRDINERVHRITTMQTSLPGVCGPPPKVEPETAPQNPLLDALQAVKIDELSPLEALNLLHTWKKNWG